MIYSDGLTGNAGDWIIMLYSSDVPISYIVFEDSSDYNYEYPVPLVSSVANSGNVVITMAIIKLPVTLATGDVIRAYSTGSGKCAIAAYRTQNIYYPTQPLLGNGVGGGTAYGVYGDRVAGLLFPHSALCTISSVDFSMYKYGNPTGTLYVDIVKGSTNQSVGTLGTLDVSTLGTSSAWKTFNTSSVKVNFIDDNLLIRISFSGGDINNYVGVNGSNSSYINGSVFGYTKIGNSQLSLVSYPIDYRNLSSTIRVNMGISQIETNVGNSTNPATLAFLDDYGNNLENYLFLATVGAEDSGDAGDLKGTWLTTDSRYIYGNEQKIGTTGGGDAANVSIYTAAKLFIPNTAFYKGEVTGTDSIDWAIMQLSLKGRSASYPINKKRSHQYIRR